ncbi:MAG: hypothetical protein IT365_10110 [Candidatus Hydrogenedentes bacterium]|nr:hypothetical protein [Candidatus Hydrogenedentota bacterium]
MFSTEQSHSICAARAARHTGEAGMGLGSSREGHPSRVLERENSGLPEDTNPLMERALCALRVAEQVRFGWV